jgi:polyhydroxyalkanoate synthesis repressor PhaR
MKQKKNELRVIKKYQNRRLYDTATSTYVILEDIKQMIMDGDMIRVVDIKTEEDVTRGVLLQIISDQEANGKPIFSNDFLVQIIRLYGKAFQASLSPFLEHGIDLFRKVQKNFYGQIRDMYGKDKLSSGAMLWKEFMQQRGPQIETSIKEHVQHNTNSFLKMQEQFQLQTQNILEYIKFPFGANFTKPDVGKASVDKTVVGKVGVKKAGVNKCNDIKE